MEDTETYTNTSPLLALPGDWYVLQVRPGHERGTAQKVRKMLELRDMEGRVPLVHVAEEWVDDFRKGDRRSVKRVSMPGYIVVNVADEMDDELWSILKSAPGVLGFPGGTPVPLSAAEAGPMLAVVPDTPPQRGKKAAEAASPARTALSPGDPVSVVGGAFADLDGTVAEVAEDGTTITVMLELFDRDTPVQIDATLLEAK